MPWPMVHFAIASELLSNPTPEFIVGSLAPDSIHVRTNERAEKAKTHLMPEAGRFATDEELRAFFNSNKKRAQSEPKFMQYLCGYISHVYTDRVWTFEIYPAFEEHANGRSIYTEEVTKLEFIILRKGSDGHDLLNKLEAGKAFDLGGLLEQEVYQYRKEKVDFLNNLEHEPLDDLNILSMEAIEEFIQTTAQRLRQLFTKWDVFEDLCCIA
ncbi:zinc dependent phospholipase C family protein [Paenibacillus taichungensis]